MSLLDDKLETFVAVCETKNFTKAGEILGLDCNLPCPII